MHTLDLSLNCFRITFFRGDFASRQIKVTLKIPADNITLCYLQVLTIPCEENIYGTFGYLLIPLVLVSVTGVQHLDIFNCNSLCEIFI